MRSLGDLQEQKIMSNWLEDANDLLAEFEYKNTQHSSSIQNDIFIIGAPRSGTTILSQFIAATMEVGYVNNLMASFWRSPVFGALLSKKLITNREIGQSSNFGQTNSVSDLHEFGGFWREALSYENMDQKASHNISWKNLTYKLEQISTVMGKPMLYKVFHLYWHLSEFHSLKPNSKWLWIERDIESNANSLLNLREVRTGSRNNWISAKPLVCSQFVNESAETQVVSQVIAINRWIESELSKINNASWLKVNYEQFTQNPTVEIEKIAKFLNLTVNSFELNKFIEGIKSASSSSHTARFEKEIDFVFSKAF